MTEGNRLLGLVIDRSGSMSSTWSDAVGAFEDFVEEWSEKDPDLDVVVTWFNHQVEVQDVQSISDVGLPDHIGPDGFTALYDATMMTIGELERVAGDNDRVVVAIITDGMENHSTEHTDISEVNNRIEEKQDTGWEIVFLGISNDEWARRQMAFAAGAMGVKAGSTYTSEQTSRGYGQTYGTLTQSLVGDEDS